MGILHHDDAIIIVLFTPASITLVPLINHDSDEDSDGDDHHESPKSPKQ